MVGSEAWREVHQTWTPSLIKRCAKPAAPFDVNKDSHHERLHPTPDYFSGRWQPSAGMAICLSA